MKETSLGVLKGIISENGGTSTAKTMVPALKELGQVISGGSSGGSSSGGPLVINATGVVSSQDGSLTVTADKTFEEVLPHLVAGGDAVMLLVVDGLPSNSFALRLCQWSDTEIIFIGFNSNIDPLGIIMDDSGTYSAERGK